MVPCFHNDIKGLVTLTDMKYPPASVKQYGNIYCRWCLRNRVWIVFMGSELWHGRFTNLVDDHLMQLKMNHQNFWESSNLLNSLKSYCESGKIVLGSDIFICTNNTVSKSTYFKVFSKSSKLHNMIVDLGWLEMERQLIVHFLFILGKRISQGTDGLFRGHLSSGIMQGKDFLKYLPFMKTALDG